MPYTGESGGIDHPISMNSGSAKLMFEVKSPRDRNLLPPFRIPGSSADRSGSTWLGVLGFLRLRRTSWHKTLYASMDQQRANSRNTKTHFSFFLGGRRIRTDAIILFSFLRRRIRTDAIVKTRDIPGCLAALGDNSRGYFLAFACLGRFAPRIALSRLLLARLGVLRVNDCLGAMQGRTTVF